MSLRGVALGIAARKPFTPRAADGFLGYFDPLRVSRSWPPFKGHGGWEPVTRWESSGSPGDRERVRGLHSPGSGGYIIH